ncbi:MAG: DUF3293 domain-containing protein [Gammaproteobacteria bacterium]
MLADSLVEAYRQTHYTIDADPAFELRVDKPSDELARLMSARGVKEAMYVTAWNPLGELLSAAENAKRQRDWRTELADMGLPYLSGRGVDPRGEWMAEESELVLGVGLDEACRLGQQLKQNAILHMARDAVPRLVLLR